MEATDVNGDVDVDDVTVGQRSVVRYSVTDDVVDRGADGLREAAVVQRRRVLARNEGLKGEARSLIQPLNGPFKRFNKTKAPPLKVFFNLNSFLQPSTSGN